MALSRGNHANKVEFHRPSFNVGAKAHGAGGNSCGGTSGGSSTFQSTNKVVVSDSTFFLKKQQSPHAASCGEKPVKSVKTQKLTQARKRKLLQKPIKLGHSWSIWYDKYIGPGHTVEEYENALHHICTFNNVQDFWRWFNHLPSPERLSSSCSYHIMREGTKPLWEDKGNQEGGNFPMHSPKSQTDAAWKCLVINMISGQLASILHKEDDICGLTVSIRAKGDDIIDIWNARADLAPSAADYFKSITSIFAFSSNQVPMYRVHRSCNNFGHAPSKAN